MQQPRHPFIEILPVAILVLACACGEPIVGSSPPAGPTDDPDNPSDAGSDPGGDAGSDAGGDAGGDAGSDAGSAFGPLLLQEDDVLSLEEDDSLTVLVLTGITASEFGAATLDVEVLVEGGPVDAESFEFSHDGDAVSLTITPLSDQFGSAPVELVAGMAGEELHRLRLDVEVAPVNDPPTLSGLVDQSTDKNEVLGDLEFGVADVDDDVDDLEIAVSAEDSDLATITASGSGDARILTITPESGAVGSTLITVSVDDGDSTVTETFELTILETDDPPAVVGLADVVIDEDTMADVEFGVEDDETPLDDLVVTATSNDQGLVPDAAIVLGGSEGARTISITPVAGASGDAVITVSVADGMHTTDESFTLTVTSVDDPPTVSAIGDPAPIDEDTSTAALAFTVGDEDTDLSGLVIMAASDNGSLLSASSIVLGGSGAARTVTVQPLADQSGTAAVTVSVSDGTTTVTTTFTVTVDPVDDPPVFTVVVSDQTTSEDAAVGPLAFTVFDKDTGAGALVISAVSDGGPIDAAGLATTTATFTPTVTVTPQANQVGTSNITLSVSDGNTTVTDIFVVTVTGVDDPPEFTSSVADQTIDEDDDTGAISFSILDVDSVPPGLALSATASGGPVASGGIVFSGITQTAGAATPTVTVTPQPDASGTSTITVTLTDGTTPVTQTFDVTVNPVNDQPTVGSIADQTIDEDDSTGALPFAVGDVDDAVGSLVVTASSSNTSLVPNAPINLVLGGSDAARTIDVVPLAQQFGSATVTVSVSDGGTPVTTDFLVTVTAVNDPPTVTAIADQTIDEDDNTGALAFTVDDLETAAASLLVTATSSNTALVPNSPANLVLGGSGASRTLTVMPTGNQSGTATITVQISDGDLQGVETLLLTVTAVNDPPTITAIADQTVDEDNSTGSLNFTVGDVETAAGSLIVTATSSNTALVPNSPSNLTLGGSGASRTIDVAPADDQSGTATITVQVTDGATSVVEVFVLTVNAVNDPPTISAVADQTIDEDDKTGALAFTVGDLETAAGSLVVSATSSNTTLVPNSPSNLVLGGSGGSRTIDVVPSGDLSGTTTVTVQVSDGVTPVVEALVVTVSPVDDPPTITVAIPATTIAQDSSSSALAFTVGDVDTALGSLVLSAVSTNTTLLPEPASYVFGGSGASRTVTLTPATGQAGVGTLTLRVADATTLVSAVNTFVLTVASNVAPVAVADTFATTSGTVGNTHKVFSSVLTNDTDDGPTMALTATAVTGGSTGQGGLFDMNTDGTFTYYPPVRFIGTDTFSYTLNDNDPGDPLTDTGTVSVDVTAPMVWFVDNEASAGGDGRSHRPFNTLASVNSVTTVTGDDQVLLDYGDGTSENQNAGVVLQTGMDLIGVPDGLNYPVITNTGGDAVTLAADCTVQNLDITNPTGAGITGGSINGATVIQDVNITGTGSDGIHLDDQTGGSLTVLDTTLTNAGDAANEHGIELLNIVGTVLIDNASIDNAGHDTINLEQSSGTLSSMTVRNSDFANSESALEVRVSTTDDVEFSFVGNTIDAMTSAAVYVWALPGTTTATDLTGTIDNNTMGVAGVEGSGARAGVNVDVSSAVAMILAVTNNVIHDFSGGNGAQGAGIEVYGGNGTPTAGKIHLDISGNTITEVGGLFGYEPVYVDALSMDVCANIANNAAVAASADGFHYQLYDGATLTLEDFTANATTTLANKGNTSRGGSPDVDDGGSSISAEVCLRP